MIAEPELIYQPYTGDRTKFVCGFYALNQALLKHKPNHYVLVPLKSSEYYVEIVNSIANVTLTQVYHNPTDQFLEVEYNFPVNPQACIYRFVAEFGKTRIEGLIKEKEEAKKEYIQAVKQGRKAAYGELNAESKDTLKLKVGNLPPGESCRIEVVYLQELSLSCNMFYQLHMTGTISPRYMNYIPGEVFKAGFRNNEARSKGDFYWDFKISLKTARKVIFFDSNTHDVQLLSQNDMQTESQLAMTKAAVPNKDFVFSYTIEDYQLPSYVFGRSDAGSTAMVSFIPKFCTLNIDDAYKASVAGKGFQTDIQNAKGEYIFLLDRSGSMGGKRIEKAKQALILFIKSLPEDTYFNVVSFGSSFEKMFNHSVKYSDKDVNSAVTKIKNMSANLGGTEIFDILHMLLVEKPKEGYPKHVFLLTDGGVQNTEGVIKMVGLNNKYSRVHTIGIGNGCSEQLILGCAKKGKGQHAFINDQENPSEKIIQLLTDSLSPVISKMKLDYDKSMVESVIPNPESLPYVLKGELVNFYITFKGQLDKKAAFSFTYEDSLNKLPYKADIEVDPNSDSEAFIDRMGHFKRIRMLEESHTSNGNLEDLMYYVKVVDKKAQAIKESVKHQVLSEFTAFVCVEKELVDGKYQEVKDKGQLKVNVQNPQPVEYSSDQDEGYIKAGSAARGRGGVMRKKGMAPPAGRPSSNVGSANMQFKTLSRSSAAQSYKPQKQSGGFFNSIASFFKGSSAKQAQQAPQNMQQYFPSFGSAPKSVPPHNMMMNQMSYGMALMAPMASSQKQMEQEKDQDMGGAFDLECDMENQQIIKCAEEAIPQSKMQRSSDKKKNVKKENKVVQRQRERGITMEVEDQKPIVKKPNKPSSVSITDIVALQSTEGSWKDLSLVGKLVSQELQNKIASEANLVVLITYIIAKWIEKHHPEKQYSLVVKKGFNFVKKNTEDFEKIKQTLDQYIA